jgi:hypothetical protein
MAATSGALPNLLRYFQEAPGSTRKLPGPLGSFREASGSFLLGGSGRYPEPRGSSREFPDPLGSLFELPGSSRKLHRTPGSFRKLPGASRTSRELPGGSRKLRGPLGSFREASGNFPGASWKLPGSFQDRSIAHHGDGKITREEYNAGFDTMDLNKNRTLSKEEFTCAIFSMLGTDGNGTLSTT